MEKVDSDSLAQLPREMLQFVLQHASASEGAARLGQLSLRARPTAINTPHYLAPTSRGVIPHLSQDIVQKHTKIAAVYFPLEDFIEKSHARAPIYSTPVRDGESRLRRYTCLPDRCLSVVGPRRVPNMSTPAHNTNSSIAISTSVGFRFLEVEQYNTAVNNLAGDVSVSLADVVPAEAASVKRIEKSADRTHAWLRDMVESREDTGGREVGPVFASIPPLEPQQLSFYLSDLRDEYKSHISGLCVYSPATTVAVPEGLRQLPIMCLDNPSTPQAVLAAIYAGVDMMTVPFVTRSSEHGIALTFSFPGSTEPLPSDRPLGDDMWSTTYATDLSPLSPDCECFACQRHHRAYVHHLLQANEMLAWTLLQIHNYHIIDSFFAGARQSIEHGTFEADLETFSRTYQSELPKPTGQGPRLRGYQVKSVGGGESKKNPKAYGKLDDQMQKLAEAESGVATPDGDAEDIEKHGLAERVD